MIIALKYSLVRILEFFPSIHTFIYNNIDKFDFLFPHEKDFYGLKKIFKSNHVGDFLDVGGNIGLSTIGFRCLGFTNNKIYIFEPNVQYCDEKLKIVKKKYKNINVYFFGLSSKNSELNLYTPEYNNKIFHFLASSNKIYVINKLKYHYKSKWKKFNLKKNKIILKKFDDLKLQIKPSFVKIDVEGHDHEVIYGMRKSIKKYKPVILIEYNPENFNKIYYELNEIYSCYIYNIISKKLETLTKLEINNLLNGSKKGNFFLSSRNIYFISNKWKLS